MHPRVGVVVAKDGKVLATAHRGRNRSQHAEFVALESDLADDVVAGSTVYTTLEPCTSRGPGKTACAERLISRKVRRVVVGMVDPNPAISGRGISRLREANIEVDLFPSEFAAQVEDLNRAFIRSQKGAGTGPTPEADDDATKHEKFLAATRSDVLFSNRLADAFPGGRGLVTIDDADTAIERSTPRPRRTPRYELSRCDSNVLRA